MSILGPLFAFFIMMLPFAAVVAVVVYVLVQQSKQRKAFADTLRVDPDVEPIEQSFVVACQTRRPPIVRVTQAGGGKNNPTRWDVTAVSRVGSRTTLHVSEEGLAGNLREKLGFKDVHVGDDSFDKAHTVRGSEPDVVRGIFSEQRVRDAIRDLLQSGARAFDIRNDRGDVYTRFPRNGISPFEAKQAALAVQRALVILDEHADAPARAEPLTTSVSGSASGAPVGVPIGGREIR